MAAASSSRTASTSGSPNLFEPIKVLTECGEQNLACRFQFVHSGHSVRATFRSCLSTGLELVLDGEQAGDSLRPQAMVCISFPYRSAFCGFLSCVTAVNSRKTSELVVTMPIPQQLTTTNLRQSFRIPVLQDAGLEVIVRTMDDQTFTVNPRDIAQSGIEIEFLEEGSPALLTGTNVDVELRFRGEVVTRPAEVRRTDGTRLGLLFADQISDSDHAQASRMNGMVLSLQQAWLRARLK